MSWAVDVEETEAESVEVSGPAPTTSSETEATGVPGVDSALERLRDLDAAPVEAHVEIFDDVQRQLHEALAELDE